MTALPLDLPRQQAPASPAADPTATPQIVPPLWLLRPTRPAHRPESVEVLARVSRSMCKVRVWRLDGARGARATFSIFSVLAFRLKPPAGVSEAEGQRLLATAPWQGHGPDPLLRAKPTATGRLPV